MIERNKVKLMKVRSFLSVLLLIPIMLFSIAVSATEIHGKADVPYKSMFGSSPSAAMRQEAIEEAKKNAWNRYTSTFNPAKLASYKSAEQEILSNIDEFIIDISIVDEFVNKDSKVFTVAIRASINEAALNSKLNSNAASSGAGGEMISFIFMAREVASLKEFDARRTDVRMDESDLKASGSSGMQGGNATVSEQTATIAQTTTGGSTLRKANEVAYQARSSADVDTALTETLSAYGFDVVGYPDVVANCGGADPSVIESEFSSTDEMSVQTRKSTIDAARSCGVNYMAVGTLDIGLSDIDPVTGSQRVFVSVRSQVWDIAQRLPRRVSSVGPVQYQGLGPDATVAMRNALVEASRQSAMTIVDQLNARGVR